MEDPTMLLERIIDFARRYPGIDAVIQTGSRARNQRVDAFSDLDIELIGPGSAHLMGSDNWLNALGDQLVSIHLANEEDNSPDWPTCLVVFAGGRKVDFTLAGNARVERMTREGLDDLYQRGYVVLLDKNGVTQQLPPSDPRPPEHEPPSHEDFITNQREFWFEATQIPIYAVRGDLWPAQLRLAELRALLLTMLEWNAKTDPSSPVDTWHNGHHLEEWLPQRYIPMISETFAHYDREDTVRALHSLIEIYATATTATATRLGLPDLHLQEKVVHHVDQICVR